MCRLSGARPSLKMPVYRMMRSA